MAYYQLTDLTLSDRKADIKYPVIEEKSEFSWVDYRNYLFINILDNNLPKVKLVCAKLNLKYLPTDTAYALLNEIIHLCRQYNRNTIGRYIIDLLDATALGGYDTLLESTGRIDIDENNLHYMLSLYPARSFTTFIIDMIDRNEGQFQEIAVPRLYSYFESKLTVKIVRDLVDVTADLQAPETNNQMRWALGQISQYLDTNWAPKPKWIGNFITSITEQGSVIMLNNGLFVTKKSQVINNNDEEYTALEPKILLTNSDLTELTKLYRTLYPDNIITNYESLALDWRINRTPPSIKKATIKLSEGIPAKIDEELDINTLSSRALVQQNIIQNYTYASPKQRYEMMLPVWRIEIGQSLENDIGLFRLFGPANPHQNTTYPIDTPTRKCSLYGGCRMLLCRCYADTRLFADEDADIGDIEYETQGLSNPFTDRDWFSGNCDKCGQIIRRKSWAVRKPVGSGGWKGCYCDWDCVMYTIPSIEDELYDSWIEVQKFIVNLSQKQCIKYGIQDYA